MTKVNGFAEHKSKLCFLWNSVQLLVCSFSFEREVTREPPVRYITHECWPNSRQRLFGLITALRFSLPSLSLIQLSFITRLSRILDSDWSNYYTFSQLSDFLHASFMFPFTLHTLSFSHNKIKCTQLNWPIHLFSDLVSRRTISTTMYYYPEVKMKFTLFSNYTWTKVNWDRFLSIYF